MYVVHRTLGSRENSQDLVLLGWYYGGPYVLAWWWWCWSKQIHFACCLEMSKLK